LPIFIEHKEIAKYWRASNVGGTITGIKGFGRESCDQCEAQKKLERNENQTKNL
jgi:hypothetical protein